MSANTLAPREWVGNGYYRDVVMSDEGDTVIKSATYGEGRACNANEVKTFQDLADKVWKFRFGGKKSRSGSPRLSVSTGATCFHGGWKWNTSLESVALPPNCPNLFAADALTIWAPIVIRAIVSLAHSMIGARRN